MATQDMMCKLLTGLPLGRGRGMTNLCYHVPTGPTIKYWSSPEDLRMKVLDYATMGQKYLTDNDLVVVLRKFDITRGGRDEYYNVSFGNFMTPDEMYTRAVGYTVNCGNPLAGMPRDATVNAVFLSVFYQHKCIPRMSFHAYYALFAVEKETAAVCVGYL